MSRRLFPLLLFLLRTSLILSSTLRGHATDAAAAATTISEDELPPLAHTHTQAAPAAGSGGSWHKTSDKALSSSNPAAQAASITTTDADEAAARHIIEHMIMIALQGGDLPTAEDLQEKLLAGEDKEGAAAADVSADGKINKSNIWAQAKAMAASGNYKGAGATLRAIYDILTDPRGVNDKSPSKHPIYPACGFISPIVDSPHYCDSLYATLAFEAASSRLYRRSIVNDENIYTSEKEPCQDPGHTLPRKLLDLGAVLPQDVDPSVVEQERHTYYWYYRLILNMYTYVKRCVAANVMEVQPPPYVPEGYCSQRLYYTDEEREEGNPAIGQSFIKGEHMIVSFRGTVFSGGVRADLAFGDRSGSDLGVAGKLNRGFSDQVVDLVQDVEAELNRHPEVTRLTLSGHSLGAALCKIMAAVLKVRRPALDIEVVAIAGPSVGDKEFCEFYDRLGIRSRNLQYIGNGVKTSAPTPFGVGDIVVQGPAYCWPIHGCPGTEHGDPNHYVRKGIVGGRIIFYAEDMPNTDKWHEKEQFMTRTSSVPACHGCSYLCWASQGLPDPEDRCYFNSQKAQGHPYPCVYSD